MARGLSDEDLSGLRQQLSDGKRPRVQLSGPHFPAGAVGTVVRIGQPDTDGPDFLRVRVKVDNMTDELAFGPAELKLPGRPVRAGARKATAKKAPVRAAPAGPAAPAVRAAPADAPVIAAPVKDQPVKTQPAKAQPKKTQPAKAQPKKIQPTKAQLATTPARRRGGPMQKVSFTISSAGATWSVTATRGSKNVVKNATLSPGLVGALAELLDQPALSEAVGEINDAALTEAQQRADQLRAELSRLEAVLATHSRP